MKKYVSILIAFLILINSNTVFSASMSSYENLKLTDDEFILRMMEAGITSGEIEVFLNDMDSTVAQFQERIYLNDVDEFFILVLLQNMQLPKHINILIAFDMYFQDEIVYMLNYRKVPDNMYNFKMVMFSDKLVIEIPPEDEFFYEQEPTPPVDTETEVIPEPDVELPFDDIKGKDIDWCIDSVLYLYERGIVSGTGEKTFEPEKAVTREEFLKMIVSATVGVNNSYIDEYAKSSKDEWYHSYLATAEYYSLLLGIYEEEKFESDVYITRQDMTTIAYRALIRSGVLPPDIKLSTDFMDMSEINYYAIEPIKEMQEADIIHGTGNNMFKPYDSTTRAEAAKIVHHIMEIIRIYK